MRSRNEMHTPVYTSCFPIGVLTVVLSLVVQSQAQTWRLIPGTGNHPTTAISIYGPNPDTMYATGIRKFLRSSNGGRSWDSVSRYRAGLGAMVVDPFDSKHIYLSHDGISFSSNDASVSTDAGQSWVMAFIGSIYRTSIVEPAPSGSGAVYVGVGPGRIYRTTNRGLGWTQLASPTDFLWSLAISKSNDSVLYAGCDRTGWKSTNGGNSWAQVSYGFQPNQAIRIRVDPRSENIVYATMVDRGVYKSTDGGTTWNEMNTGIPASNRAVASIAINPKRPDEVYVGVSANGDVFYRSTNGGALWESYGNGLPGPGATVNAIAIDTASNRLFLGVTGFGDLSGIYSNDSTIVSVQPQVVKNPNSLKLLQNYPNPFNPVTSISYDLLAGARVSLKVYDMLGREVATLVDGFVQEGYHRETLNAAHLASGVYFYRIQAGSFVQTKKLLLLR